MNRKTLAAAMKVALSVARRDEMSDKEWEALFRELTSFQLTKEEKDAVANEFCEMPTIEAVNILRAADADTRREAQALTIITMLADGEFSDREKGAWGLMYELCSFEKMSVEEAHKILGF